MNMATKTSMTELQARISRRLGMRVERIANLHGRWFADVGRGWEPVSDLLKGCANRRAPGLT